MFDEIDIKIFFYVVGASAAIMAALWYFVIAPMERRNHERKLAMLQQRIKAHEENLRTGRTGSLKPEPRNYAGN